MNRFIINLKSLDAVRLSQDSSTLQHGSTFSAPNFRIPDSFLGNIGEDLQDGHQQAHSEYDDDQEASSVSLDKCRSVDEGGRI